MNDIWIPIIMAVCLTIAFIVRFWLSYKQQIEVQKTIRKTLEQGQQLSPQLLKSIGTTVNAPDGDVRRGIILLALAIAIIIAGSMTEIIKIAIAVGAFPLSLSLAYFLLYKLNPDKNDN